MGLMCHLLLRCLERMSYIMLFLFILCCVDCCWHTVQIIFLLCIKISSDNLKCLCMCALFFCRMLTNSWISCWMSLLTFLRKSLMWQKHPLKRHLCRKKLWMVQTIFKTMESRKSPLLHGCTKVFRWIFISHSSFTIIILVWQHLYSSL